MADVTIGDKALDLTHLKNLYHVETAYGSPLTYGLRKYTLFFDVKRFINRDNDMARVAWTVAQCISGVILYPIFGLTALIGVAINEIHLRSHNEAFKKWAIASLQCTPGNSKACAFKNALQFSPEKNVLSYSCQYTRTTGGSQEASVYKTFVQKGLEKIHEAFNEATDMGLFAAKIEIATQKACTEPKPPPSFHYSGPGPISDGTLDAFVSAAGQIFQTNTVSVHCIFHRPMSERSNPGIC